MAKLRNLTPVFDSQQKKSAPIVFSLDLEASNIQIHILSTPVERNLQYFTLRYEVTNMFYN